MSSSNSSNRKANKICNWCHRPFEYRKKWEENWDQVKLCSDQCRNDSKNKKKILNRELINYEILNMTKLRSPKSLCPSEISRKLFEDWQSEMESVRQVCRKLHLEQKIIITQKEMPIKELNFKGPIRIKSNPLAKEV